MSSLLRLSNCGWLIFLMVCVAMVPVLTRSQESLPFEKNCFKQFDRSITFDLFQQNMALEQQRGLLSNGQEVFFSNRLILITKADYWSGQEKGEQASPYYVEEDVTSFRGISISILHYETVVDALKQLNFWQKKTEIYNVQPDLLPIAPVTLRLKHKTQQNTDIQQFDVESFRPQGVGVKTDGTESFGQGIKIAVIDHGFKFDHPSLQGVSILKSWDLDFDVEGALSPYAQSHGSKVMGVIWSDGSEVEGYEGVAAVGLAPKAQLIALKLTKAWTSKVLKALIKAERQGADIINISWLLPWVAEPLQRYIEFLTEDARSNTGIAVVAAADPLPSKNIGLAALAAPLVVSAVDYNGMLGDSSWDENVDIATLGYVPSVYFPPSTPYGLFAKTSASTALMSGFVALVRQQYPKLSFEEISKVIQLTAIKRSLNETGKDAKHYLTLEPTGVWQYLSKNNRGKGAGRE